MAKLGAIDFTSQVYSKTAVDNLLRMKQDVLVFDDTPTAGSVIPVTSDGIKRAIDAVEAETGRNFAPKYVSYDSNDVELSSLAVDTAGLVDEMEVEVADIAAALALKANSADLADVAFSGNYEQLNHKPTIPDVYDGVLTFVFNGIECGTFSANQPADRSIVVVESDPVFTDWRNGSSIAAGAGSSVGESAVQATAYGDGATAEADSATALGSSTHAKQDFAVAVGNYETTADGSYAVAVGTWSYATADSALSVGCTVEASGANSIAVGSSVVSSSGGSIAAGYMSVSSGRDAIAIGSSTQTSTSKRTQATANDGIAVGREANAGAIGAISVGKSSIARANSGVAIGSGAMAASGSQNVTVVGGGSRAAGTGAIVLGANSYVGSVNNEGTGQVAVANGISIGGGPSAPVTGSGSCQIGIGSTSLSSQNTLRFRDWTLLDSSGNIPADRLGNLVSGLSGVSAQIDAIKNGTAGGSDLVDVRKALLVALGS